MDARFGPDGSLYVLSRKDAPRGKILRMPLAAPSLAKAATVVPEGDSVLESFLPAVSRLYTVEIVGGPKRLRVFDLDGNPKGEVPILPVSSVGSIVRLSGDEVLFRNQSYLAPRAWYRLGADGKVAPLCRLRNQ